ncbi:MAG: hypothetical protein BWY76_01851 [bacterium ADurb.Bin429]|nr:MAG: hypothetical protein BWY76_01851 [bacterium ADurb.Bin429]
MDDMSNAWLTSLRFLDADAEGLVDYHTWERWPDDVRGRLEQTGLLQPRDSALAACDQCAGKRCRVPIEQPITWQGTHVTARCGDTDAPVSTAQIRRERIRVWTPEWMRWVAWLRQALRPVTQAEELIPQRLWKVGRIRASDQPTVMVYFARGLWWAHEHSALTYLPTSRPDGDIVITLAAPRPPARMPDLAPMRVVTLAERLIAEDDGQWGLYVDDLVITGTGTTHSSALRVAPRYHLHFDAEAASVVINGITLSPSRTEYRIFHTLAQAFGLSPDTYRSDQYLVERAYDADDEPGDVKQAVKQRILALRKKMVDAGCLDPSDATRLIQAKSGYGYRLNRHLATVTFTA